VVRAGVGGWQGRREGGRAEQLVMYARWGVELMVKGRGEANGFLGGIQGFDLNLPLQGRCGG